MRQFIISAAVTMAFAALAAAPAQADHIGGGPIKQNGQCWAPTKGVAINDQRWGTWGACPATASASVASKPARRTKASR
jgi:hypothetical protein